MERERFPGLDLLKGISAWVIACLFHYRNIFIGEGMHYPFEEFWILDFWGKNGAMLVELFFSISGLLFYHAYYHKIADHKEEFRHYFLGRVIRLYPLMIVSTIVMAVLQWALYYESGSFFAGMRNNDIVHLFYNLLGIQMLFPDGYTFNQPTWYISVSMLMFAIFYLIAYINKKYSRLIFLLPIYVGLNIAGMNFALFNRSISRGLIAFFIGVVLGILLEKGYSKRIYLGVSMGALAVFASVCILFGQELLGSLVGALELVFFPAIIVLFVKSSLIGKMTDNRIISYFGKISFGIYIWNIPVYCMICFVMRKINFTPVYESKKIWLVVMLIVVAVSVVSYECLEKPVTKFLKKRFL